MVKFEHLCLVGSVAVLLGCSSLPAPETPTASNDADLITHAEAKAEACPIQVLEAGASPSDCQCVETKLFTLGQVSGALKAEEDTKSIQSLFNDPSGKRKIAIGLLRHDAMKQCGLFDPSHIVAKNL